MKQLFKLRYPLLSLIALLLLGVACGPATDTDNAVSGNGISSFAATVNSQAASDTVPLATEAAPSEESAAPAAENTAVPAPTAVEVTPVSNNSNPLATDGKAPEVDAKGLTVGFTADGRPYRGDINAPVVIEEFSDYQCPFCSRFAQETLPTLEANQVANGEVVIVYYDYPLTSIHPQSYVAAVAAQCAGAQGPAHYWAMHDLLFATVSQWSNPNANTVFVQHARDLGLNVDDFSACLEAKQFDEVIQNSIALGNSRGVNSTPSFFLNNQPLIGAYPVDTFNSAITAVKNGETIASANNAPTANDAPAAKPTPVILNMETFAGAMGDPNAPVTIVEFTDLQCPFCERHFAETLPQLKTNMIESGRIYYVVKDLPLESIHPNARTAANAARCAADQGAYWEMHDGLFSRQAEWVNLANPDEAITAIANDIGLDQATFSECFASRKHDAEIQTTIDEATSLGIRGTPFFYINGFPINGAQPYDLFEYAIGLAEEGTLADAYVQQGQEEQQAQQGQPSQPVEISVEDAYSIGDPKAPITIIEYTDYQCPFCSRHFNETVPQIRANYVDTGVVHYVYKDFPLTSIHPQAYAAAVAARCAGDQGAYPAMHDALFTNQAEWSGQSDTAPFFIKYADQLNLDTAQYATCLTSGQHDAEINADIQEGQGFGINGTPSFFLNGYFLSGAQPFATFQQAVETLLAQQEEN